MIRQAPPRPDYDRGELLYNWYSGNFDHLLTGDQGTAYTTLTLEDAAVLAGLTQTPVEVVDTSPTEPADELQARRADGAAGRVLTLTG